MLITSSLRQRWGPRAIARHRHICEMRRFVHVHYMHWWDFGGPTNLDNLITLCTSITNSYTNVDGASPCEMTLPPGSAPAAGVDVIRPHGHVAEALSADNGAGHRSGDP